MVTLPDIISDMRLAASAHEQWAMSWEASAPEAASCTAFASQLKVWADALMALTGADVVENDDTCASTHTIRCTLARGHDGPHTAFRTRVSWTGDVDATARLREILNVMADFAESTGDLCCTRGMHETSDCRDRCVQALRDAVLALSPLRSTPQEGTTDDLTRIGELDVPPPPQHASTNRKDL